MTFKSKLSEISDEELIHLSSNLEESLKKDIEYQSNTEILRELESRVIFYKQQINNLIDEKFTSNK